ncbi:helix-turn-helix transcriptional regulator [Amycolatopsis acidiphila]|uniref:Helix-turn-helix transcriptional regulator n=1 Tax=Amycolatopsis acidiphila TaxID=715473 RepID=A0A558A064_9PSEU|nr:helix-turn-helix transcriptional regulator [Amycolatopsis acidiphila]TVT17658.1 helix-turn-helix transcriptional regulator [Amycolatopsis acidiphila]UIJ60949.1 helix-turn-helix transcriptional regulator [Amycolatopsis acidiphila]GHG88419.1 AraC family transcriptional regulator [Amycolatopsis acidiphila]
MRQAVVEAARFLAGRCGEPITLCDVADHVGYSPFHLSRAFERQLGLPPGQFLAAHRFQRAKRLLLSTDERVIDVCHAVGFSSVGTFTARFTAAVGQSPVRFRRLPEALADAPPEPVIVPGAARDGGIVTGSVRLTPAALALLGGTPSVYVGLFPRRTARGFPVSGTLLGETSDFLLMDVPAGTYWVLASALPARAGAQAQLVPGQAVSGAAREPVRVTRESPAHHREVWLDVAREWDAPVLVALPPLASATAGGARAIRPREPSGKEYFLAGR